jgi:hypothetical protein
MMNTNRREHREVPCLVPTNSVRGRDGPAGTRNGAIAGAGLASAGGAVFWSVAAGRRFRFCVSFGVSNAGGCRTGAEKPNQSGVKPPHSKQPYRPMDHGKADSGSSGRLRYTQKKPGRGACRWQDARYTMREAETSAGRSLPSLFRRGRSGGQKYAGRTT